MNHTNFILYVYLLCRWGHEVLLHCRDKSETWLTAERINKTWKMNKPTSSVEKPEAGNKHNWFNVNNTHSFTSDTTMVIFWLHHVLFVIFIYLLFSHLSSWTSLSKYKYPLNEPCSKENKRSPTESEFPFPSPQKWWDIKIISTGWLMHYGFKWASDNIQGLKTVVPLDRPLEAGSKSKWISIDPFFS